MTDPALLARIQSSEAETRLLLDAAEVLEVDVPDGTREAVIQAVEDEMGYYDIPEAEPAITFTGKTVCDLVDLAKELMVENDKLDKAAHDKTIEILALKTPTPSKPSGEDTARISALEALDKLLGDNFRLHHHYAEIVRSYIQKFPESGSTLNKIRSALFECRNAMYADNPADGWKEIIDNADEALKAAPERGVDAVAVLIKQMDAAIKDVSFVSKLGTIPLIWHDLKPFVTSAAIQPDAGLDAGSKLTDDLLIIQENPPRSFASEERLAWEMAIDKALALLAAKDGQGGANV